MKFIRIRKDKILTPVIEYKRNNIRIKTIGAIHIGKESYYEFLQKEVDSLEYGLYEGLEKNIDINNIDEDKRDIAEFINELPSAYQSFATTMGCKLQDVKYPDNWDNSDIRFDDFINKTNVKGLLYLSIGLMMMSSIEERYKEEPEDTSQTIKFIFKNALRLAPIQKLLSGDTLNKELDEIVINERNSQIYQNIDEAIENRKYDEFGIIYGAAHLDGIDNYLIDKGFKKASTEWIEAVDVKVKPKYAIKATKTIIIGYGLYKFQEIMSKRRSKNR